ncbi:hypothetical protein DB88DRAFT_499191, partial [Papiliotrema laurentii]
MVDACQVLLGLKKRGFGVDLYNGFGGKPDTGEDMVDCARRELEEESGLRVSREGLSDMGKVIIARPLGSGQNALAICIHLFACTQWTGTVVETDEMRPAWFSFNEDMPWGDMWPEARLFLPQLLSSIRVLPRPTMKAYIEYHLVSAQPYDSWRQLTRTNAQGHFEALAGWKIHF